VTNGSPGLEAKLFAADSLYKERAKQLPVLAQSRSRGVDQVAEFNSDADSHKYYWSLLSG
jgi:hypothetical protein